MEGNQQADGVDTIADAAESECPFNTEFVNDGATKEPEDSKCAVEGGVLIRAVSART